MRNTGSFMDWADIMRRASESADPADLLKIIRGISDRFSWESIDFFLYSEDLNSYFFPHGTEGELDGRFREAFREISPESSFIVPPETPAKVFSEHISSKTGYPVHLEPLAFNGEHSGFVVFIFTPSFLFDEKTFEEIAVMTSLLACSFNKQKQGLEMQKLELENALFRKNMLKYDNIKMLGEMTGGITHDLNNVFTGVSGFAQLLEMTAVDEESLDSAREILRAADSGKKIVNFISRLKKLSYSEQDEIIDLVPIIHDAAERVKLLARQSNPMVSEKGLFSISTPDRLDVTGNAGMFEQVFVLLFSKLIITGMSAIDVTATDSHSRCEITIQYSRFTRNQAHPLVTTELDPDFPESLAIHALSDMLHLDVEIQENSITIFYHRETPPVVPYPTDMLADLKVLVYEPDASVARMIELFLRQILVVPKVITSPEELGSLDRDVLEDYDRIIIDISGFPFLEKQEINLVEYPIILTSAWGKYLDLEKLEETKVKRVLLKPFTFNGLRKILIE